MAFTNNILKTYFWQFASNALRFLSMFIVAPFLTKNQVEYGIYMVCTSTLIFFTFADFGFWGATLKFVSEFVGKKDKEMEIRIIGFSLFINSLFIIVFMAGYILLVIHPEWIMKDLSSPETYSIARKLLALLVIWAPFKVIERSCNVILSSRICIYLMRRVYMGSSLITIGAVFFFFNARSYDIVGYFGFSMLMEIVALGVTIWEIGRRFDLKYIRFIKTMKFDKKVFGLMKNLALSNFYTNIVWVLFANFDLIYLGRTIGAHAVAIYGVAMNLLNYFETFIGSSGICGPYLARFNHIVGIGTDKDMRAYFIRVVNVLLPAVVLPIICMVGMLSPFILCWVGKQYVEAINLASILLLSMILHFISMPAGYVITARNKAGILAITTTIMVVIYWGTVFLLMPKIGMAAMPLGKTAAYLTTGIFSVVIVVRLLKVSVKDLFIWVVIPCFLAIVAGYTLMSGIVQYLPTEKNKINLLLVIVVYTTSTGFLFFCYSLLNPFARKEYFQVFFSTLNSLGLMRKRG